MAQDTGQERTEEATPRRRIEARRKGTVAKSIDLTNSLVLLGIAVIAPTVVASIGAQMIQSFRGSFGKIPSSVEMSTLSGFVLQSLQPVTIALVPLIMAAMAVGLASNFAQVGFVASGEPLNPTFEKINPFLGLKRLFSSRSAIEGFKAALKSILFGAIVYSAIRNDWNQLLTLSSMPLLGAISLLGKVLQAIVIRVAITWLILAALDYLFQKKQTNKQLMMTRDELRKEFKEQEGSPELKAAQARRRGKLAKGRLVDRVQSAAVVITNPKHYAVAIAYDRSRDAAPIVVAMGQDYLAQKIREIAAQKRIPLVPNPPLARALYRQCEVGDFVPRSLFQAVAEVLAYVYRTIKTFR